MPDAWDEDTKTVTGDQVDAARRLSSGRRDRAYVIVIAGPNVGEMFKLDDVQVVGRGANAQVRLSDSEISRNHARLVLEAGGVFVEDLKSTNGTFVNGDPITYRELEDGDKIQVGTTTILKFSYHADLDEEFQRHMYDAALRDSLTGSYNQKYFLDRLESELAFAERHKFHLALVLFDIAHFKRVNDAHGHPAGDAVLRELAAGVLESVRKEDVFARYGGEEFAVLSRGLDTAGAVRFGERLRGWVEGHIFAPEGTPIPVTVSVGVVSFPDSPIQDPAAFLKTADEALYRAKGLGRNRVCAPRDFQFR